MYIVSLFLTHGCYRPFAVEGVSTMDSSLPKTAIISSISKPLGTSPHHPTLSPSQATRNHCHTRSHHATTTHSHILQPMRTTMPHTAPLSWPRRVTLALVTSTTAHHQCAPSASTLPHGCHNPSSVLNPYLTLLSLMAAANPSSVSFNND